MLITHFLNDYELLLLLLLLLSLHFVQISVIKLRGCYSFCDWCCGCYALDYVISQCVLHFLRNKSMDTEGSAGLCESEVIGTLN